MLEDLLMSKKLELALVELIRKDRFYAQLLMRMRREITTSIDSIGVRIDLTGITLMYNPVFFDQLEISSDPDKSGSAAEVLKHECEHVLRGHADREVVLEPELRKPGAANTTIVDYLKKCDTKMMLNIAEDLEINESLPNLPDSLKVFNSDGTVKINPETGKEIEFILCKVKVFQATHPKMNIKNDQTMEYYYSILKKIKQEGNQANKDSEGNAMAPIDDHSQLNEGELDSEIVKQLIKNLVNEAYESLDAESKSNLPSNILEHIKRINNKTKNWRKELKQFKDSCTSVLIEETRRRRNRRYGLLYPGRRSKPILHLVVGVDTSGSVDIKALEQVYNELDTMKKIGINITVIECDSAVQKVYEFNPKKPIEIIGRGGTSFEPVFDLVKTKEFKKKWGKVDGLVYFTDGEDFGELVKKPNFKVLWALYDKCDVRYAWGNKVLIDVNQKH